MPLKPPRPPPGDMGNRDWSRFIAGAGIQASSRVLTFPPTWTGFSVNPTGNLSYQDFGELVALFNDNDVEMSGTSNAFDLTITNLPEAIRPSGDRFESCLVVNANFEFQGGAKVEPDGTVRFYIGQVVVIGGGPTEGLRMVSGNFLNTDDKGLPAGWLIMYSK